MNAHKIIGGLLIAGAVALLIPYNMLIVIFEYPDILRQSTATVLTKFYEGGDALIWTWFAFAVTGLPLLPAYIMLGQKLERQTSLARMATTLGVVGLIVQMIGLLRWTFVVPVLADSFVHATDEPTRTAAIMAFKTIHQFGGVVLGEHLGQLFTIAWTVLISYALYRSQLIARWVMYFGYAASAIYLAAQLELFATVMPSVPVWDLAGFIGSTLWLVWIVIVGIVFVRRKTLDVSSKT